MTRKFEYLKNSPIVDKYSLNTESTTEIINQWHSILNERYDNLINNGTLGDNSELLLMIVQNNDIAKAINDDFELMEKFNDMISRFKGMNVAFIFTNYQNASVSYDAPEPLRLIKQEQHIIFFEDLDNLKPFEVPYEEIKANRKRLETGDAYYIQDNMVAKIADDLNTDGVPTPSGKGSWLRGTIQSILTNEKYKGDAVLNKTYISDCLTKKVKINNGERPKYYVENNHPAIIDSATFGRVQEEMARRSGKRKVKQVGTKTEQGKYSGKYALTELLICGECGTPYRRCTWTNKDKKKIVWRCINRLDYGKKYCNHSPSVEESVLQNAIMTAVVDTAKQNADVLKTLKLHIGMGLDQNDTEDKSLDIQIRIAEIDAEFHKMLKAISADTVEAFDEVKATELMNEKSRLEQQLAQYADAQQKRENAKFRIDEIYTILDGLKNHPLTYDDQIIRQILECVVVESKEKIKVVFVGGLEVGQEL